jgi:hypothetical protein
VVDDSPYRVIDERTLRLDSGFGPEDYPLRIEGGDRLTPEPVIPDGERSAARANPSGPIDGRVVIHDCRG